MKINQKPYWGPFVYVLLMVCWVTIILGPMILLNAAGETNSAQMTVAGFLGAIMGVVAGLMWCGVAKIQDLHTEITSLRKELATKK
jgi:uncharacterized membrane protein YdjX (TVP38/TMEM64 family)